MPMNGPDPHDDKSPVTGGDESRAPATPLPAESEREQEEDSLNKIVSSKDAAQGTPAPPIPA
jgi:hypothetical protein